MKVLNLYNFYYKNGLKNFGIDINKKPLEEITHHDIENFKAILLKSQTRRKVKYAPQTVVNILNLISIIFNFAIKKGYFSGMNPFIRVDKIKHNRILLEFLNQKQIDDLIKVLDNYENKTIANLIKILLYTGMRRGEVFKLKWSHIDFESKTIKILNPKGGQDLMLNLSHRAFMVFKEQKEKSGQNEYVFPDSLGKMRNLNNQIKEWYEIREKAGVHIRLHSLRHTFATLCVSAGVPLTAVQTLLGHKNYSTTLRYAHVDNPVIKKAVTDLDTLLETINKSQTIENVSEG